MTNDAGIAKLTATVAQMQSQLQSMASRMANGSLGDARRRPVKDGAAAAPQTTGWTCTCGYANFASRKKCRVCESTRDALATTSNCSPTVSGRAAPNAGSLGSPSRLLAWPNKPSSTTGSPSVSLVHGKGNFAGSAKKGGKCAKAGGGSGPGGNRAAQACASIDGAKPTTSTLTTHVPFIPSARSSSLLARSLSSSPAEPICGTTASSNAAKTRHLDDEGFEKIGKKGKVDKAGNAEALSESTQTQHTASRADADMGDTTSEVEQRRNDAHDLGADLAEAEPTATGGSDGNDDSDANAGSVCQNVEDLPHAELRVLWENAQALTAKAKQTFPKEHPAIQLCIDDEGKAKTRWDAARPLVDVNIRIRRCEDKLLKALNFRDEKRSQLEAFKRQSEATIATMEAALESATEKVAVQTEALVQLQKEAGAAHFGGDAGIHITASGPSDAAESQARGALEQASTLIVGEVGPGLLALAETLPDGEGKAAVNRWISQLGSLTGVLSEAAGRCRSPHLPRPIANAPPLVPEPSEVGATMATPALEQDSDDMHVCPTKAIVNAEEKTQQVAIAGQQQQLQQLQELEHEWRVLESSLTDEVRAQLQEVRAQAIARNKNFDLLLLQQGRSPAYITTALLQEYVRTQLQPPAVP